MNLRRVRLVLHKELLEVLRDRRTLFVTLVLPVLLHPALLVAFGTATARQQGRLRESVQAVAFAGPVPADLRASLAATPGLRVVEDPGPDPEAAVRAGRLQLLVRADPGLEEAVAGGGSGRLSLLFDSAAEPSAEARRKASAVVEEHNRALLASRLAARGLPDGFAAPLAVAPSRESDLASAQRRGAHVFGRMLAMMVVLMVVTGAFGPAVDAVAGEKERGTMETLLLSPASRLEIVLGKGLAVFAVCLATALGNLAVMALTFGNFAGTLGLRASLDFHMSFATAGAVFLLLVPLAAMYTALALALSTLARSSKEAQTYLAPLMLVTIPLAMAAMVPNVELSAGLAAVPVAGTVLLFRDLLMAQGSPELAAAAAARIPVVLGVSLLGAALALRWATWMFRREEVLFRDSGESLDASSFRPAWRPGRVPGPGGAVLVPAAALAATVFLARSVLDPARLATWWAAALQQGVLLAAVGAALAAGRFDLRATLGLRMPAPALLLAGLLLGAGSAAATPWLVRAVGAGGEGADASGSGAILAALVASHGPVALVLLLGVLPAVAEEALFRGWCLRGFRAEMGAGASVALSSILFGAFHLDPDRIAFTALLGAALGFLALRGGSLLPGLLAHALHNGITVALAAGLPRVGEGGPPGTSAGAAEILLSGESAALGLGGCAAVAVALLLAFAGGRRDGEGGSVAGTPA